MNARASTPIALREMAISRDWYRMSGIPIKFSRTPGSIRSTPPKFGVHGREVLAEIGYDADEIEALANDGKTPVRERLQLAIAMTAAYYDQNPDLRGFIARAALEPAPRGQIVTEQLLKPLYEAARPLIEQGIAAGAIPFSDPALVFVLLNSALGQPDRVAPVLAILAPERPVENLPIHIGRALSGLLGSNDITS